MKLERCLRDFLPSTTTDFTVHGLRMLDRQGRSSLMYSFFGTSTSESYKRTQEFILRIYKNEAGSDVEKGRKEFMLLNALKEQGIAVPTAYFFEENCEALKKPFMIMEKIMAKEAAHYLKEENNSKIIVKKMAESLVGIHEVNLKYIINSDVLRQQYELNQRELLDNRFFIRRSCPSFLGFSPIHQRRFMAAVKKLRDIEPQKVRPTLLHLDYEPNHILVLNGSCIVVDWGEASIGDPAFDVAWAYHKLRLGRENAKVDLGEYFVKCYEEYSGQKLVNLQFSKDNVAIAMAKWSGLSLFSASSFRSYARLASIFFGDFIGEIKRMMYVRRLNKIMTGHHTNDWTNIEYIQNYALRYLERDRYN